MESILRYSIKPEELFEKIRAIIKEALQQDQLLTKEGALKIAGISNATFLKAINHGIVPTRLSLMSGKKLKRYNLIDEDATIRIPF